LCDPGSALMFAGAGVNALGSITGLNARSNASEAKAQAYEVQSQQDLDQSALQQRQMQLDLAAGGYQANSKERAAALLTAKQEVAVGASGFTLQGSPTEAIIDSRKQAELDAQAIQYGTALKAQNDILRSDALKNKAQDDLRAADIERRSKPGALDYALGIGGAITSAANTRAGDRLLTRLGNSFGNSS
jgi:hypothetical protein